MNIKKFQIDGIMNQIQALEYANKMMSTNWGFMRMSQHLNFVIWNLPKSL
ncbi:hypothetical protein [Escherichia phage vB_EcoM-UFV05]|nr:hypothetical protein [Escherichia phage vB_EcoM-UFV09]UYE93231.1 hypothetical protein [Escherichia phage vB_EcoM-UFV05]UYL84124.1 hypothetical protein [Escherichia phage vB_EcoM-UFV06]UYL84410.1 hypothetical protein [Escherichia phage vB_EcoM-UFV10]UYL84696.1 hypothetical protein [Escherichia phage vB_EcoM-UFV11]